MAKRIWVKPKAREGRASGRERVSPEARLLAFELIPICIDIKTRFGLGTRLKDNRNT